MIDVFDYGDEVVIISSGIHGEVCDIRKATNGIKYVVDRHDFIESDNADEWLVDVSEGEIKLA
jgi:preprotein translocase subunit YajC